MYLKDCGNAVVQNCRFYQNRSLGYGGIAFRAEYSTSHLLECDFTDNEAGSRGGAIRLSSNNRTKGYSTFERCLIARNKVKEGTGSAVCVQHAQRTAIVNSTIYATSQLLAELSLPTERIMTTRMSCLLLAVHLLATREMDSCNLLEYRT